MAMIPLVEDALNLQKVWSGCGLERDVWEEVWSRRGVAKARVGARRKRGVAKAKVAQQHPYE